MHPESLYFTRALLAGIAVFAVGCRTSTPPDPTKIKVLDPTISVASSSNLLNLFHQLNQVYTDSFGSTVAKIAPEEKSLLGMLGNKANAKGEIAKDHKLFSDAVATANQALINLSNSTSTNVDPMEHDKYAAYYTAIGEDISAHGEEYQAFLNYESKPTDDNRIAILNAARIAQGKDLAYTTVKR
jgi:hypothetical protein